MKPVNISLVGVTGFARSHQGSIERLEQEGMARLVSVVDIYPDEHPDQLADYQSRGITVYTSFDEMLENEQGRTELVALPVAIPAHGELSTAAMRAGYHVVLEKPPAPTVQEVDEMMAAEQATGRFCAVGFQSQSRDSMRQLKHRLVDGRLGDVSEIVTWGCWARDDHYYARNKWAGKLMVGGRYCLDGPTTNAMAHYLNNPLYLASPQWHDTAAPRRVRAEMYSGHRIESEDTTCLACETDAGVMVYYFVTLCAQQRFGPVHRVVGTKGTARWTPADGTTIEYADGSRETIEDTNDDGRDEVFRNACRVVRGKEDTLNCTLAMSRNYVLAMNGAFESCRRPRPVPDDYVTRQAEGGTVKTWIGDIDDIIRRAADERKLFSDLGVPWAEPTDWFSLDGYRRFALDFS